MRKLSTLATALLLAALASASKAEAQSITVYRGLCDASAAVALGKDHFVVADDEQNMLQIYKRNEPAPVTGVDLSAFLGTKPDKESDLEGAAAIGKRIYWISSHGTNKKGEVQDRRKRLFATDIVEGPVPTVQPVEKPYSRLVEDLAADPKLAEYKLGDAAKLPPKTKGALNIEGLADGGDGKLLIGFRNPLPGNKALIVPLENPESIITGGKAKLGEPIELDLDGQGIRSLEKVGNGYLIVAGAIDGGGKSRLLRWSGSKTEKPTAIAVAQLDGLNPEALFAIPGSGEIQILSDDGTVKTGGEECKDAPRPSQSFRSVTITP